MRTPALAALAATLLAACDSAPPPPPAGPLDHLLTAPRSSGFVHVSSYDTAGGNRDRHEVAPGDSVVLLDLEGPGIIRHLWMTVASRDPYYLRRIALEMYWDGEAEPSVRAPLGDFFGNPFDRRHYAAWPMGVSSGGFFSYLPMPFRSRARIVARNGTGRVIDAFYFNADVERPDALPEPLATFHATWHRDPRTTSPEPHRVLEARGAGHLVGMSLAAESHDGSLFFLEGDERLVVDGEFRGQGTGTEDYFNAGWYFDQGPFAAPYHGLVVKDDTLARIAAYRWHLPDPVPFLDSIRFELEHGHANEEVADYATVAYWYQIEPHAPLPPLPPADERRVTAVKIPSGAVEASRIALATAGAALTLEVPVPRPDRYELLLYPRGAPGAGTATVRMSPRAGVAVVEGDAEAAAEGDPGAAAVGDPGAPTPAAPRATAEPPPVTVDLEAAEPGTLPPVSLGEVSADSSVTLVMEASGGAPPPEPVAVEPRPVRRFARAWSVVGPFPNPQRLGTEYSPALDSAWAPESEPSLDERYRLPDGREVGWRPVEGPEDGYVRLNPLFEPADHVAAYALTWLYAPDARDAVLLLGADDAHVLWVNGREVSRRQGRNISVADDLAVPVSLEAGWNRVLLKVADLDGGWAFQLRAADPAGELRWARRPGG